MFRLVNVNGRAALEKDGSWHDLATLAGDDALADPLTARTARRASATAAARVDAEIGNRLIMGASLILDRGPIKTRFGRDSVPGTPAEALSPLLSLCLSLGGP